MLKTFRYFLRSYKYDLVTAIFGFLLTTVTFIYAKNQNAVFSLSFVIITISLIIIIYIRFREKDFFFVSLLDRKQKDDWIGNGLHRDVPQSGTLIKKQYPTVTELSCCKSIAW